MEDVLQGSTIKRKTTGNQCLLGGKIISTPGMSPISNLSDQP